MMMPARFYKHPFESSGLIGVRGPMLFEQWLWLFLHRAPAHVSIRGSLRQRVGSFLRPWVRGSGC